MGLFRDVVAYVDIQSPFGNPSNAISQRLISLGATVEKTRNNRVTHVIFRYGDPMTKLWAEKRKLNIVTPAWVKACIEHKCRVPEACYYLKEKEDLDLAEDFTRIASKASLAMKEASFSQIKTPLSSTPTTPSFFIPCPKTPPGMRKFRDLLNLRSKETGPSNVNESRKKAFSTTSLLSSDNVPCSPHTSVSHPASDTSKPPPGWMCLPSPPENSTDFLSPLSHGDDNTEGPQPSLNDVIGSSTISHIPLSPDVLNFVVRNCSTSVTAAKRRALGDGKIPSAMPAKVTPNRKNRVSGRTPTQEKGNALTKRRSSLRIKLLKKIQQSGCDIADASKSSKPKRTNPTAGFKKRANHKGPPEMKPDDKIRPRRSSLRLFAKAVNSVMSGKNKATESLNKTGTAVVESGICLKSTMDVSYHTVRNSLDDFIIPIDSKSRRCTRSSLSSTHRMIEIVFSGLNSFQRQTLTTLLRSSSQFSEHEAEPKLNSSPCSVGGLDSDRNSRQTALIAAILGKKAEPLPQRWRFADSLSRNTTTHLVTTSPFPRTINLFKAILAAVPVVDEKWIVESAKAGKWLPFKRFLVPGLPSVKTASILQKLFSTVGPIFLAPGISPSPPVLSELITMGGGSISKRSIGADLIVGQLSTQKPSVSPKWILDSILHRKLLPFDKYREME